MGAFSEWIDAEMTKRRWGLRPVGKLVGVRHTTVGNWREGRNIPDARNNVPGIARAFGVEIDFVLQLCGYPTTSLVEGHAGGAGRALNEDRGSYLPARVRPLLVVGDCLSPDIRPGDVLYMDPELEALPGDIVTLRAGDEDDTIIRRLVGGRWPKLVCNHEEERYDPERVTGVAVEYRRGLRR